MLSETQQYQLGYRAGEILGEIHTLAAATDTEEREKFYSRKIDKKIKMYNDCDDKIPNRHKIIEYINANRHLIKTRPSSFHHGDYHLGNMGLPKERLLYIIDFNRWDFGDPWEEFN